MQRHAHWERVKAGAVGVEGGWRIYSSGPGIYAKLVIGHVLGRRRKWGRRTARPLLPRALQDVTVELDSGRDAGLPPIFSDATPGKK